MSSNVGNSFQVSFQNNMEMVVQQRTNPLESAVEQQDEAGEEKAKIKDLIGNNKPKEADERHGDTKYNDTAYDGVWIPKTNEIYDADLVDRADQLATKLDLKGSLTMTQAGTIARGRIMRILQGFAGPIISGKNGLTSTPFPGGQIIPVTVGGAAGAQKMNTAKLRAADKLLKQGYAIPEGETVEKFMVITADDNDQLLTEIPATSDDFKGAYGGVFENGNIRKLLGWTFIHLELDNPLLDNIPDLYTDGSGYRKNPFWVKNGVRVNNWDRLTTMVDRLPGKLGSTQVFSGTTLAATRTQAPLSGFILNQKG